VATNGLVLDELCEVLVDAPTNGRGIREVARWHLVRDVPREDVADPGLSCFIPVEARDDASVDDAAHSGHLEQGIRVHDVACRCAHDRDHLAGLGSARRRGRDVSVNVADRDGDANWEARPLRGLRRKRSRRVAELADGVCDLRVGEVCKVCVERRKEFARRVFTVLQDPFVARGARVANVRARELPHDPVGRFDPVVHCVVDLGILFEKLQALRELPLARDQAAVAREPRLAALGREFVDAVGLRLRRVVLPELDVRVGAVGELGQLAERRTVCRRGDHRARREVRSDSDHGPDINARVRERRGNSILEHVDIVRRNLKRPLGRQSRARGIQNGVHYGVAVVVSSGAEFCAIRDPYDDSATGKCSVVNTDDILLASD
jgi:hypothetical protein